MTRREPATVPLNWTRLTEMPEAARLRDDSIADLRRRLDTASAQLGEALQQMRLLTDQRPNGSAPSHSPDPPRSPWRRLLRALGAYPMTDEPAFRSASRHGHRVGRYCR